MAIKKNLLDHKDYLLICAGLVICLLAFLYFQHPRVEIRTQIVEKKVYIKSDASITGATNASLAPDGSVSVSGKNLSIATKTETRTSEKDSSTTVINNSGRILVGAGWDSSLELSLMPSRFSVGYGITSNIFIGAHINKNFTAFGPDLTIVF
jgi:hypothetical protein